MPDQAVNSRANRKRVIMVTSLTGFTAREFTRESETSGRKNSVSEVSGSGILQRLVTERGVHAASASARQRPPGGSHAVPHSTAEAG